MGKRVIVKKIGVVHYYAQCERCTWDAGINSEGLVTRSDVRNAITKHVRETGHSVNLESGTSTKYTAATSDLPGSGPGIPKERRGR